MRLRRHRPSLAQLLERISGVRNALLENMRHLGSSPRSRSFKLTLVDLHVIAQKLQTLYIVRQRKQRHTQRPKHSAMDDRLG